jgi:5,5'-dehydrodivanillate O-demethylase
MDAADNEALTRVTRGTPAGEMLRRYWWPVGFTEQVTTTPLVTRILGEDLVLFRDGDGKVGLLDRKCPHRGTQLDLGRVELSGLRCCYHGWLFDRNGQCLDQPCEPPDSTYKDKINTVAYDTYEAAGLIFAYLGPKPTPAFPKYDMLFTESYDRFVFARESHCNWLQRAENTADPYHVIVLHAPLYPELALVRPEVTFEPADYGIRMRTEYPNGVTEEHHTIFPGHIRVNVIRVGQRPSQLMLFNVPVDDTTTHQYMVFGYETDNDAHTLRTAEFQHRKFGEYTRVDDEWWRIWERDQDDAAQESQGRIADRTTEHLATSDRGVIMLRKMLREAIDAVAAGQDPMHVIRDPNHAIIPFNTFKAGIVEAKTTVRAPEEGAKLQILEPYEVGKPGS